MWQVLHCPATVTWLWFHLDAGAHVATPWHEKQWAAPTGMCVVAFGGAPPLAAWQPAQFVAALKLL